MVSIIVPVYNVENYLPRCIESIQRQTMQDLEIILVDDGSTDSSGMICDDYALRDNRIKVIHQQNGGQVAARNTGLAVAKGKYIGFVDGDDWIEEDMISFLYETAVMNEADVVAEGMKEEISGCGYCSRNALPEGIYRTEAEMAYLCEHMISCDKYFKLGILPYLWNKLFRRELVTKHMLSIDTRIRLGEDAVAVYTMLSDSKCVVVLASCHYHYCLRETSIMAKGIAESEELESAKALYTYLQGKFLIGKKRIQYERSINSYVVNVLLTRLYERFVRMKQNSLLFPFDGIEENDSIIIYGAGALGKAVFKYVSQSTVIKLKGWADGNYEKYQKLGMPVRNIDTIDISSNNKILVAVFSNSAFEQIKETLISKDIDETQILGIEISAEEEQKLLNMLNNSVFYQEKYGNGWKMERV